MTAKNFPIADLAGLFVGVCLGVLVLVLLSGCTDSPPWGAWSKAPTQQQVAAAMRHSDTYIYFSNYQIYNHPGRGEYTFWDGQAWVTSNEPPVEVSAELLQASPAVELELHAHPAMTHAEVARRYPRDWRSPDSFVAARK